MVYERLVYIYRPKIPVPVRRLLVNHCTRVNYVIPGANKEPQGTCLYREAGLRIPEILRGNVRSNLRNNPFGTKREGRSEGGRNKRGNEREKGERK